MSIDPDSFEAFRISGHTKNYYKRKSASNSNACTLFSLYKSFCSLREWTYFISFHFKGPRFITSSCAVLETDLKPVLFLLRLKSKKVNKVFLSKSINKLFLSFQVTQSYLWVGRFKGRKVFPSLSLSLSMPLPLSVCSGLMVTFGRLDQVILITEKIYLYVKTQPSNLFYAELTAAIIWCSTQL